MYNDYFGLSDAPFSIAPNPQFLYMSELHREALAHLLYGIRSDGGFLLLTGEVGTGKTTVCRCFLEQMPEYVDTAFVLNPKLTAIELLATICDDLHIQYPDDASIKVLVDKLNLFLLDSHQQDRRTVLIIDEAQNLSVDVLEQLRLLTNLETNQRKLLQIILLGQPELLTLLARPELRQLSQRVTARFHLEALGSNEIADYIQHRLKIAGAKGNLFPTVCINRIYKITQGIPRLINLVCDRALLGTYVQNQLQVDIATINNAAREILGDNRRSFAAWKPAAIAASAMAVGVAIYLYIMPSQVSDDLANATLTNNPALQTPLAAITTGSIGIGSNQQSRISLPDQTKPSRVAVFIPRTNRADLDYQQLDLLEGYTSQNDAFATLFQLWGTDVVLAPESDACSIASHSGLKCLSKLGSLESLGFLNRPVIVNLTARDGKFLFLVTKLDDQTIGLEANRKQYRVSRLDFKNAWDGYYTLLWRMPPAYDRPTALGDKGAAVDWLGNQMAIIENSNETLTINRVFDEALESKVKQFQISVNLVPDGVVGALTWIHINSIEELSIPTIMQSNG